MKKAFLGIAAAAATFAMAPAANAAVFGPEALNLVFGPGGTISAEFGRSGILANETSDTYNFTIPQSGMVAGSVITNANVRFSNLDLDFVSVFLNGIQATGTGPGLGEALFVNMVPITAGVQNTLTVNFVSRGNGSYGGQGSFSPTAAVPEPATWGMMILGFLGMGYTMRRRSTQTRVRFV